MAYGLEKRLYKKSDLVTGQTQGIVKSINERFPSVRTYWLPNGVDLNYFDPEKIQKKELRSMHNFKDEDILLLYAGILGHAQGLEVILKAAEQLKNETRVKFLIAGSGPLKNDLIQMKQDLKLENVIFIDIVPKKEMPALIKAVDIALVPLKKLDLFKGAIPSKIFENCAMKKMLLLGVEGEAKELFIDKGEAGLFFEPEDEVDLISQIKEIIKNPENILKYGESGRAFVNENFNRDKIAKDFYLELQSLEKKS